MGLEACEVRGRDRGRRAPQHGNMGSSTHPSSILTGGWMDGRIGCTPEGQCPLAAVVVQEDPSRSDDRQCRGQRETSRGQAASKMGTGMDLWCSGELR